MRVSSVRRRCARRARIVFHRACGCAGVGPDGRRDRRQAHPGPRRLRQAQGDPDDQDHADGRHPLQQRHRGDLQEAAEPGPLRADAEGSDRRDPRAASTPTAPGTSSRAKSSRARKRWRSKDARSTATSTGCWWTGRRRATRSRSKARRTLGTRSHKLKVDDQGRHRAGRLIDAKTFLEAQVAGRRAAAGDGSQDQGASRSTTSTLDLRRLPRGQRGEVPVRGRRRAHRRAGSPSRLAHFTEKIEVNVPIEDAMFAPPATGGAKP